MRYQLRYSSSARHALNLLPRNIALRFVAEFEDLAEELDPRLHVKRLRGGGDRRFIPFASGSTGQYCLS